MPDEASSEQTHVPRIALLAALAVALLALALYLRTLHPGVGPSLDSIELQIAALVRGVIHPPGSPQYLMLGTLAMQALPGPSAAARLNLMSALLGAATVGVTFLLAYRVTRSGVSAGFAALLLAMAPRLWYQSSIAELYTLNAFYVALVLYLLVAWHQNHRPLAYWAAAAVYALSFGNHLSMILLLPAFIYVVEITDRTMLLKPRNLAITAVIVIAAALQYLYIPARVAAQPPFCNYCPIVAGETVSNPAWLVNYLTGGPFKGGFFAVPRADLLARLPESIGQLARQFMPWGVALGFAGVWELFQRRTAVAWTLVLGLAAEYLFVLGYNIPDWHDFLTPVYVIFAALVGYGAQRVWELLRPQASALLKQNRRVAGYAYPVVLIALAALALGVSLYAHLPLVDQSDDTAYEVRARALLDQAEPGVWVLMPRSNSPAFYYSWAVRYVALARGQAISVVSAPEVDPPPGPPPGYIRWADAEGELAPEALIESGRQVFALEWADERLAGLGLLAVCTGGDEIAGYEVVAVERGGEIAPLVDAARWERISGDVAFDGSAAACPAEE